MTKDQQIAVMFYLGKVMGGAAKKAADEIKSAITLADLYTIIHDLIDEVERETKDK